MAKFASETKVSVTDSKAEIERTVIRYGADGFMSAWSNGSAIVAFTMHGRQVRFKLQMPDRTADEFNTYMRGSVRYQRESHVAEGLWEQACRQRWRALALVVKAKLEAVESDISTFEDEFLANIVMPGGTLVGDEVRQWVADAYATGKVAAMLPDYSGGA